MSLPFNELTDQNRYILRSTETALRTGREFWAWWHESEKTGSVKRSVLLSPTATFESSEIYDSLTLDSNTLKQHMRVHENVILGTRQIWDTRTGLQRCKGRASAPPSSHKK
jgi:hypothetical protein